MSLISIAFALDSILTRDTAEAPIGVIAYCSVTRRLVTASRKGVLQLWDTERCIPLASYRREAEFTACAITPDGERIIVCDGVGRVRVLERPINTPTIFGVLLRQAVAFLLS